MATMTGTATEGKITLSKMTPVVQSLPLTATVAEVMDALKLAGGCIVRQLLSEDVLDQIEEDVRPELQKDSPWTGSFFPAQTRRAYAMLETSETFATKLVMHPLYQGVADALLTESYWFWEGQNQQWAISKPQLNNTIVFSIGPGATAQPLHRDDSVHRRIPVAVDVYPEDMMRDSALGFFVAAKKATKANGATRFIPGSHLWGHETPPNEELCEFAEMEKGDAFFMLASCFHGGSANRTTDEERLIFSSFMTRGYLRQEENQYLVVDKEKMKKLPVEVQKVAGYSLSEPFMGWVASTDPRVVLDPTLSGSTDMWTKEKPITA